MEIITGNNHWIQSLDTITGYNPLASELNHSAENYMFFPIESAFKYSHQLNRNESSNGFHILRSHFKFTYSVAFSENYGSVTF